MTTSGSRAPRWADIRPRFASWWGDHSGRQLLLLAGVVLLFGWLGGNAVQNMHRFGLTPGFGFLAQPSNFEIGQTLIEYSSRDSYARAILVGLLNTLEVGVAGVVLASVLGLVLGVARLSGNPLLGGLVQAYVELIRNTPLLLQLFFWSATIHALPPPRRALEPFTGLFLTNRGVFVPAVGIADTPGWLGPALLAGVGVAAGLVLLRRHLPSRPVVAAAIAAVLGPPAIAFARGWSLTLDVPELDGFNFIGGATLGPESTTLLVGLVVNFGATISEIVRGGILAVPRGQWDAGRALGLSFARTLRLIVLPQALRVAIPLLTSSYLSLIKSSSLAVAIGFPDLTSIIGTSANQTGQAVEAILILTAVYLSISLAVSVAMNHANRRFALRN
jgi:general L-amino acid transport system permease protein